MNVAQSCDDRPRFCYVNIVHKVKVLGSTEKAEMGTGEKLKAGIADGLWGFNR
jgi:hypothetical protein